VEADRAEVLRIAEQAAEWLARLPSADQRQRTEFMQWLRYSPVHVREFLLALHTAERLGLFRPRAHESGNVVPLNPSNAPRAADTPRSKGLWRMAASIAAALTLTLLLATLKIAWLDQTVRSDAGEWVTIHLDDGSTVVLGPRSQLTVDLSDRTREIRFARGEALFEVAKDEARPFVVTTDFATVRALGTKFGVDLVNGEIRVTVETGSVVVTQKFPERTFTVTASQELHSTATGDWVALPVDAARKLAWGEKRLIFNDETLADAIAEFNRRNAVQLRVDDPSVAGRAIRGSFEANDPLTFARTLERVMGVAVKADGRVLHITSDPEESGTVPPRPNG
jgi:transmembrane sensor